MNTRHYLIIAGIVIGISILGVYQYFMYQCGTLPIFMETPYTATIWNCLEIMENSKN